MTDPLVSTAWLAKRLADPDIRILDASFKMPGATPTARDDWEQAHLPKASFFDIDAVADDSSPLPHMLPSEAQFASYVGALGIGNDSLVVVYDAAGVAGATRAWWSFRAFGHEKVAVLDGGLTKWRREGRAIEAGPVMIEPGTFVARRQADLVSDRARVSAAISSKAEQILDARAKGRFEGIEPEPWPGRRQGHIPGSANLDHAMLWDSESRTFIALDRARQMVLTAGIDVARPVVTTCGSGITATVLAFTLYRLGGVASVYDGSWAEWGLPDGPPIATGPSGAR